MKKINRLIARILIITFIFSFILRDFSAVNAENEYTETSEIKELINKTLETALTKGETSETEIIVKYKENTQVKSLSEEKTEIKNRLGLKKFDKVKTFKNRKFEMYQIEASDSIEGVIEELNNRADVEYAQPNYILYTNALPQDQYFSEQWGHSNIGQTILGIQGQSGIDINVLRAWEITTGIQDVLVGIVDSGVDINHTDLVNSIYINTQEIAGNGVDDDSNGFVDDVRGWDFYNNDNTVFDSAESDYHGTHVAGIISASANTQGVIGVAPNVKILPVKFVSGTSGTTSDAIEAIDYAKEMGVNIVNCSWGGSEYNFALKDAIANSGMLFVCSAGNEGTPNPVNYPASFQLQNTISVAAMQSNGSLSSFSNYGDSVDVAAPGENIISTLPGNQYGYKSGTSMATPFVTGIAALIKSYTPEASPQSIASTIKNKATTSPELLGYIKTGGYVNAYASLQKDWTNPSQASVARYGHACSIVNGNLYSIGGFDGAQYISIIEKYDTATNTWSVVGNLTEGKTYISTVGINNKIYAIGGFNGSSLATVEEYDTDTNQWISKTPMNTARYGHSSAFFNGKIYVFGGKNENGYIQSIEVYTPETDTWETSSVLMPSERFLFDTAVLNDQIFLMGGRNSTDIALKTVEAFNPVTGIWETKADMLNYRRNLSVEELNNKIYVFGGSNDNYLSEIEDCIINASNSGNPYSVSYIDSVEFYNPDANTWSQKQATQSNGIGAEAITINDNIYIVGGWNGEYLNNIVRFDTVGIPKNLYASMDNSDIKVQWNTVNGATGYEIDADGTIYDVGNNTSYIHINPDSQVKHQYKVRAYAADEIGTWSETIEKSIYDTIISAKTIAATSINTDIINSDFGQNWYKIVPETQGMLDVKLSSIPTDCYYRIALYDNSGMLLARGTEDEETAGLWTINHIAYPTEYYIKVYSKGGFSIDNAYTLESTLVAKADYEVPDWVTKEISVDSGTTQINSTNATSIKNEVVLVEDDEVNITLDDNNSPQTMESSIVKIHTKDKTKKGKDDIVLNAFSGSYSTINESSLSLINAGLDKMAYLVNQNTIVNASVTTSDKKDYYFVQVDGPGKLILEPEGTNISTTFSYNIMADVDVTGRYTGNGSTNHYALCVYNQYSGTHYFGIGINAPSITSNKSYTFKVTFIPDSQLVNLDPGEKYINDNLAGAYNVSFSTINGLNKGTGKGTIDNRYDFDSFKVYLSSGQKLTTILKNPNVYDDYLVTLCDSNGYEITNNTQLYTTISNNKQCYEKLFVAPSSGYYYVLVLSRGYLASNPLSIYNLEFYKSSASDMNLEFNSITKTFNEAKIYPATISTGVQYSGLQLDSPYDVDVYKFTVPSAGKITLNLNKYSSDSYYNVAFFDTESGQEITYSYEGSRNDYIFRAKQARDVVFTVRRQTEAYTSPLSYDMKVYFTPDSNLDAYEFNLHPNYSTQWENLKYLYSNNQYTEICGVTPNLTKLQNGRAYNISLDNPVDVDWFKVDGSLLTNGQNSAKISLNGIQAGDDYNLVVLNQNGDVVGRSQKTGNAAETVTFRCATTEKYYVGIYVNQWNASVHTASLSSSFEVEKDWYNIEYQDEYGQTYSILLSELGSVGESSNVIAYTKIGNQSSWSRYNGNGSGWVFAGTVNSIPGTGVVCVASEDGTTITTDGVVGEWIKVKLNAIRDKLVDGILSRCGVTREELGSSNVTKFAIGVCSALDDNLLYGLVKYTTGYNPWLYGDENNYYYMWGKSITDAACAAYLAVVIAGTASEALAAITRAGGAAAFAAITAWSGGGLVGGGAVAVGSLAEAGVMAGLSVVAGVAEARTIYNMKSDHSKLSSIVSKMKEAWEQIASQVDDILRPKVNQIKQLYPGAKVGYRGSLATGKKYSSGGVFDPSDFDVDAFIVSDDLASRFPTSEFFRNANRIPELEPMLLELETMFKNAFPGYRVDPSKPFTFRIWTEAEYLQKVVPYGYKLIN